MLKWKGFEINPYERYVANKTIEVMQCTIVWYVDDNILSHKTPAVISNIIKFVFVDLTVVIVIKHTFLGVNIEIKKILIHIYMVEQIR